MGGKITYMGKHTYRKEKNRKWRHTHLVNELWFFEVSPRTND